MVQILAIGLGVSIGGGLVSLFSVKLGVAAPAYRLAFLTEFFALIFRKLDAKPTPLRTKNLEPRLYRHAKDAGASSRVPSNV